MFNPMSVMSRKSLDEHIEAIRKKENICLFSDDDADKFGEFTSWCCMLAMCYEEDIVNRRIAHQRFNKEKEEENHTVCFSWQESFDAFYRHMGPMPTRYHIHHILVRKRTYVCYCPENCEWVAREIDLRSDYPASTVTDEYDRVRIWLG